MIFLFFAITLMVVVIIGAALTVWCGVLVDDDDRLADHQSKLEFNKLRSGENGK